MTEPLTKNRDFRVLLVSQGVSALGDAVSSTALPLLILAITGSGVVMGIVGALQAIPDFVFGLFAGAFADRGDQKRMMFLADLGRAFLTALIPVAVLLNGPTLAVILIVVAPMSALRALFRAGYLASVPALVGRANLGRANGIFETVYSVGFIIGPSVAGLLATTIGPGLTLAVDAASFALSSMGLLFIVRPLRAPIDRAPSRMIDDIREGIAFILHHTVLRSVILLWSLGSMVIGPIGTALVFRITRDLHLSPAAFGIVLTAFGFGTIGGSLVAARLGRQVNVALVLLAGLFVEGASFVAIALVDSEVAIAALVVVAGVAESLVVVTYISVRTTYSPDHLLGRIGATARVVSLGLMPIGMLVAGVLIDATSGTTTIAIMGVALCAMALAFVPVRTLCAATLAHGPGADLSRGGDPRGG